jgi:hypothetical protein
MFKLAQFLAQMSALILPHVYPVFGADICADFTPCKSRFKKAEKFGIFLCRFLRRVVENKNS